MGNDSNLIIISASNGKNLELSNNFQKKSQSLNISSEILDLTTSSGEIVITDTNLKFLSSLETN